jgi:hypothetical protein
MYKFLAKYGQLVAFGLGALPILLFLLIYLAAGEQSAINFELFAGIVLFILGVVTLVGFAVYQVAADLKGSMKGLIGIGGLLVIFLLIYLTATPETTGSVAEARTAFNVTDNQTKLITGGIGMAILMAIAAAVSFFYSEVRNFFK